MIGHGASDHRMTLEGKGTSVAAVCSCGQRFLCPTCPDGPSAKRAVKRAFFRHRDQEQLAAEGRSLPLHQRLDPKE